MRLPEDYREFNFQLPNSHFPCRYHVWQATPNNRQDVTSSHKIKKEEDQNRNRERNCGC